MQLLNYQFRPKLIPTIATLILLPILISLGQWQSDKAERKQALQDVYDQRGGAELIHVGANELNAERAKFSKVVARGYYEPAYQILIDNQVYKGQAGYHVVTPLHLTGSNMRILVNRGWILLGADRAIMPEITTPLSEIEVTGYANLPSKKYIELSQTSKLEPNKLEPGTLQPAWQIVWQNLDIDRYKKVTNFELQPMIVLMDPANTAAGFVREWPKPDSRIDVNRGYAIQWYLMSIALMVIYVVTNTKKIPTEKNSSKDQFNAKQ